MERDIYIYAHWNTYGKETEYQISTYERSEGCGDVLLEKRTVSFDTPNDKELRVRLAKAMELHLQETRADHLMEQNKIAETIMELRSIEFKEEEAL